MSITSYNSKLHGYIHEAPDALRRLLDAPPDLAQFDTVWKAHGPRRVIITGSGTSLFAAEIAARLWQDETGLDARAIGALDFLERVEALGIGPDTLVIAISQTGATNVLVEGARRAGELGALVLACTADSASPLAHAAVLTLDSRTGEEKTPGKTKGFVTTTVAVGLVALHLSRPQGVWREIGLVLSDRIAETIGTAEQLAADWAARIGAARALWVVGSGRMAPAALEGALKLLEVGKLPVIGKELEEMMHGQFHAIGDGAAVIALAGEMKRAGRIGDLFRVVAEVGVPLIAIGDGAMAADHPDAAWDLVVDTKGTEPFEALVGAVPLQLLAERLAHQRGLDPDAPRYPQLYKISGSKSIYAQAPAS